MTIDRTASESGGRRDVREDMKTRAAVRTVMIPDIAMPATRRLIDRGAEGRERSSGRLYARLINGDRGGFLSYSLLVLAITLRGAVTLPVQYQSLPEPGDPLSTSTSGRHGR